MKSLIRTALPLVVILALTGCPAPEPTESDLASTQDFVPVGEYGSLTGLTSTFGSSAHRGIQMAIDEVNEDGGVHGQQIRLFTEDTQSKADQAANAVTKLVSENNVVAILGEVASSRTLAAAPIAQSRGIPMITPASTNPKVTEVGDYIFRVAYIDPFQAEALAKFIRQELKLQKGAILKDLKNDYSIGLAQYFTQKFQEFGGEIVIDQNYNEGDVDFTSQLTAVKATSPDFLFIPGYYAEVAQIARKARELGMNLQLIGADGWESPKLLEVGGDALEGAYFSSPYFAEDTRPEARGFVERFTERYDHPPDALAALGYDAAMLLADAMRRAETLEPDAIRDAIAATKDFEGVTGSITIGPNRNTEKPLAILRIQNGALGLAARVSPAGQVVRPPRPGDAPVEEDGAAGEEGTEDIDQARESRDPA